MLASTKDALYASISLLLSLSYDILHLLTLPKVALCIAHLSCLYAPSTLIRVKPQLSNQPKFILKKHSCHWPPPGPPGTVQDPGASYPARLLCQGERSPVQKRLISSMQRVNISYPQHLSLSRTGSGFSPLPKMR